MEKQNTKVIYIAGSPHSGTTLLDLVISSAECNFSVGELWAWDKFINQEQGGYNNYSKCTCGVNFWECPFWKKISNDFQTHYMTNAYETSKEKKQIRNFAFSPFKNFDDIELRPNDYIEILHRVYQENQKNAQAFKYIVDSSKKSSKLLQLLLSNQIDLKVIHLVRHGTAFYNSMNKINTGKGFLELHLFWLKENLAIHKMLKQADADFIQLSYDSFAQNPQYHLKQIGDWLNIDFSNYKNDIPNKEYHNIGGNLMRFKKFNGIKYDDSWKKKLPVLKRNLSLLLTSLPNKKWVMK